MTHWLSRFKISCCVFFLAAPLVAIKRGRDRGVCLSECGVCDWVWCVCMCVWGRGGSSVCVWGRKKNNLFKSPPSFFPPSFLCFSLKLSGLWSTFSSSSSGKWRHFVFSLLGVRLPRIFLFFYIRGWICLRLPPLPSCNNFHCIPSMGCTFCLGFFAPLLLFIWAFSVLFIRVFSLFAVSSDLLSMHHCYKEWKWWLFRYM